MIGKLRWCNAITVLWVLGFAAVLIWRAALPVNRNRPSFDHRDVKTNGVEYYLPQDVHIYDDVLTLVTARNFAHDGFSHSHWLPNRRGAPQVSLYDFIGTQCELLTSPKSPLIQWNGFGHRMANLAVNHDCLHTHYPPLADWIFGGLASCGLGRMLYYRLLAILLNSGWLLALHTWLRREVDCVAATLTIVAISTLPAVVKWADALYFHAFQLLFLQLGILTYSNYLTRHRQQWFHLAWLLFFAQTLVSPQLVLFHGIALVGLSILEAPSRPLSTHVRLLLAQATAPLAALGLHVYLCVSVFGVARIWTNFSRTLPNRVSHGAPWGYQILVNAVGDTLAPWPYILLGVAWVMTARRLARAPLKRPALLMGTFLLGGISFLCVFPGAVTWYGTSVARHLLPLFAVLSAFAVDSVISHLKRLRTHLSAVAVVAGMAPGVAGVAWLLLRNAHDLRSEIRWNALRTRQQQPKNLVQSAIDHLCWTEGKLRKQGSPLAPISGLRVNEPPAWITDLRMQGINPVHYEIWWLDAIAISSVRILGDEVEATHLRDHCWISGFDGQDFQTFDAHPGVIEQFTPAKCEATPREPFAWVTFNPPGARRALALRFSCVGLSQVTLHQIEVY